MSDPKNDAALSSRDIAHIVEASGTQSLIGAQVMSARVMTDGLVCLDQIVQILNQIHCVLAGKGDDGSYKPWTVNSLFDPASVKAVSDAVTAVVAPQFQELHQSVTSAHAAITQQSEKLTTARTELDAQKETLTRTQAKLGDLTVATAKHEEALTFALLGESGHIRRLDGAVGDLIVRVALLEAKGGTGDAPGEDRATEDRTQEMRQMNEALTERVVRMEGTIRQLLEHGPQGGGPRSPRR